MPSPERTTAWGAVVAVCLRLLLATAALGGEQTSPVLALSRLPQVGTPTYYAPPQQPVAGAYPPATQNPLAPSLDGPFAPEELPPQSYQPAPFVSDDSLVTHRFPPTVPPFWFAGVEFLMVRPVLSDAVAFLSGELNPNTNQIIGTLTSFDYNYEPSARAVFGYRWPETSSGVQFTYWHLAAKTEVGFVSTRQDVGFIPNAYIPFTPVAAGGPGASIDTSLRVRFDVYDVDFFKSGTTDDGQWYASGSIGVRIANFGQRTTMLALDDTGSLVLDQTIGMGFTGAGPRVGLEGRRNLGWNSALYVRGGLGILLGRREAHVDTILTGPAPSLNVDERSARAVTVGDVELGAAWRPLDHWVFSLGWMLQGWTNLNGFQQNLNLASNANILAVDGLSVRAEVNW